ncbi:GntR family transcriptional regulator [Breoghania corrubedonensis]|uniref:GntR family transcriptional regulator n=1 Tax=Breoghania corrubedonensis TaxID=665038 RepID=A0A2T5V7Q8_9HYPH|nr:PLP-dependent aminotransferase family protein [Breoghania corrubedonensis]PTW59773.1 GntR family transcriptional regulator [Breoghania corrubedonensis]
MTNWRPDPTLLRRPAYLSLADQIARAIQEGALINGTQLPPQRRMADELKLSVQTVSRAYEELGRRGLIAGEIGRGSFVRMPRREMRPPYLPDRLGEVIDLSILKPVCEPMHVEKLKEALGWLSQNLPARSALSFRPNVVFPVHAAAAVEWLRICGVDTSVQNVTVTNGATGAMTVALMSVAPPGSTVACEAITHHTLAPLAAYHGFTLAGLAVDEEGLVPEALEDACRQGGIRAVFIQPTVVNPVAALMGKTRREAIVEIARRYDIAIVESDVLGPLVTHRPRPFAALAPERTLYITSFTKVTVPGLRIGYLVAPDRYVAAVSNRHLVSNWMATPMVAEIATKWVNDGTALELVRWQRAALAKRHAIAAQMLAGIPYTSHPQALHLWMELKEARTEEGFVAQARLLGVAIAPGSAFCVSREAWAPSVRISIGSTTEAELRIGLGAVAKLLHGEQEVVLPAI